MRPHAPTRFRQLALLFPAAAILAACVGLQGETPVSSMPLPLPPPAAQTNTARPAATIARPTLFGRAFGNSANAAFEGNGASTGDGNSAAANQQAYAQPAGEFQRVDANLWRTSMPAAAVFQAVAKTLSQQYVISSVDRRALTLQTEWDKFFIDGRLFRNRISITVFPVGPRQTDVAVRNAVEYASSNQPGGETSIADWLPSPDVTDEVPRLIQSLQRTATGLPTRPATR